MFFACCLLINKGTPVFFAVVCRQIGTPVFFACCLSINGGHLCVSPVVCRQIGTPVFFACLSINGGHLCVFCPCVLCQHYYRHTSRELKRLSTVTLSPIYAHFTETIAGLSTIRAFRKCETFVFCLTQVFILTSNKLMFSVNFFF